jgi:hypothetical protein
MLRDRFRTTFDTFSIPSYLGKFDPGEDDIFILPCYGTSAEMQLRLMIEPFLVGWHSLDSWDLPLLRHGSEPLGTVFDNLSLPSWLGKFDPG